MHDPWSDVSGRHPDGPPCPPALVAARLLLAHDWGDVAGMDDICREFLGDDEGDGGCINCTHQVIMSLMNWGCQVADRLDEVLAHTEAKQMWPQYVASQVWKSLDAYQQWLVDQDVDMTTHPWIAAPRLLGRSHQARIPPPGAAPGVFPPFPQVSTGAGPPPRRRK
jgi:hypothetical protein